MFFILFLFLNINKEYPMKKMFLATLTALALCSYQAASKKHLQLLKMRMKLLSLKKLNRKKQLRIQHPPKILSLVSVLM